MAIFLAVVICVPCVLARIFWRVIRRRPVFPLGERKKLDSPGILYVGIGLFGVFGLAAFMMSRQVYGVLFLLFTLGLVVALIAFKRGWRG